MLQPVREVQLMLLILNAWKEQTETGNPVPWHITRLGWEFYVNHVNPLVRETAKKHPDCPADLVGRENAMTLAASAATV